MFIRAMLIILALAVPAHASAKLFGFAEVIDGDTLRMGEYRISLLGIDAPEMAQQCQLDGKSWKCGLASRDALEALIGEEFIVCITPDRFRNDQVGWCLSHDESGAQIVVGEVMVRQRYALATRDLSPGYFQAEAEARKVRRGLWAGEFEKPWVWRAQRRREHSAHPLK